VTQLLTVVCTIDIIAAKDSFKANMAKVAAVAMTMAPAAAMATEGTNEVRTLFKTSNLNPEASTGL
jgi:hypothetical protein